MSISRKNFLKAAAIVTIGGAFSKWSFAAPDPLPYKRGVKVCAHLWVYASKFPPKWDATPALEQVFSDLKYAGYDGVELMESILRRDDAVERLKLLIKKHKISVSGTSYSAHMWNKDKHAEILSDVMLVTDRLKAVGGKTFGITTGKASKMKTEEQLDAQADLLRKIQKICSEKGIIPNLHNHTWEVEDDMHEWKGMLKRMPELNLGPDLNWLVRGGVDPVWFIQNYGHRMTYMHIRDHDANGKWTEAVGEGVINYPAIAEALHKINYKGWAAVELAYEKAPLKPLRENWKTSREYVKDTFGW